MAGRRGGHDGEEEREQVPELQQLVVVPERGSRRRPAAARSVQASFSASTHRRCSDRTTRSWAARASGPFPDAGAAAGLRTTGRGRGRSSASPPAGPRRRRRARTELDSLRGRAGCARPASMSRKCSGRRAAASSSTRASQARQPSSCRAAAVTTDGPGGVGASNVVVAPCAGEHPGEPAVLVPGGPAGARPPGGSRSRRSPPAARRIVAPRRRPAYRWRARAPPPGPSAPRRRSGVASSRSALARSSPRLSARSASPRGRSAARLHLASVAQHRRDPDAGRPAGYPSSRAGSCTTSTRTRRSRTSSARTRSSVIDVSSSRPSSSATATVVGTLNRAASSPSATASKTAAPANALTARHATSRAADAAGGQVGDGVVDPVQMGAGRVDLDVAAQDLVRVPAAAVPTGAPGPSPTRRRCRGAGHSAPGAAARPATAAMP